MRRTWSKEERALARAETEASLELQASYERGPVRIESTPAYRVFLSGNLTLTTDDRAEAFKRFLFYCEREDFATILCAALYVDTGKPEPARRSYAYPSTGIVFAGWRHGECFLLLEVWMARLWFWERWAIERIQQYQLRGRNQGFVTSTGRYVDREEAGRIAFAAGQTDRLLSSLTSEDVY